MQMSFVYYIYSEKNFLFQIWIEISKKEVSNRKVVRGNKHFHHKWLPPTPWDKRQDSQNMACG